LTATVSVVWMTAVLSAAARFTLRRTAFQRPSEEMPTRKAARSYDHLGSKGEKPGVGGPDLKRSGHRSHSFGELGISREAIRYNQSCQLVLTRDNRSSWVYNDRITPQSAGRSVVRGRVAVVTNGADRNG